MGATKVYAFKPNKEAYECLIRNIYENGLENIIVPFRLAVTDNDNEKVKIPLSSSPGCKTLNYIEGKNIEGFSVINTISLESILKDFSIDHVDLLKIDCEGAEYGIICYK